MSTPAFVYDGLVNPEPEVNLFASDLGDSNWEYHAAAGMDGYGVQGFVDLQARDDSTKGLRVTVTRGSLARLASNGVKVSITRVNGTAVSAAYDASAKTLTGNVQNATTLAALKTQIDGITGTPLTTAYYGGEDGTSMADAYLGAQATFDIRTPGRSDRGVRVTIDRGSLEGDLSNGVIAEIKQGAALAVSFDTATKLIEVTVAADTTLSALRTQLNGTTGLSAAFFGGETGNGAQATFDLPTRGQTDRGLRVTVQRSALAALASNGVSVAITRINADALDVSLDASAKTVTGNVRNATTMAQLKTEVDGVVGLTSAYYGGETGTGSAEAAQTHSAGATADPLPPRGSRAPARGGTADLRTEGGTIDFACWLLFQIQSGDGALIQNVPGTVAPTADGPSVQARNSTGPGKWHYVPPGHRCYIKRSGSSDSQGSVSRYQIHGNPRRSF